MAREVLKEMSAMQGFIGVLTAKVGNRALTITAWEHVDNPAQLLKSAAHAQAMKKFRSGFGREAYTSVWTAERIHPILVNCAACLKTSDYAAANGLCSCGKEKAGQRDGVIGFIGIIEGNPHVGPTAHAIEDGFKDGRVEPAILLAGGHRPGHWTQTMKIQNEGRHHVWMRR